jgi:hypothetical protein
MPNFAQLAIATILTKLALCSAPVALADTPFPGSLDGVYAIRLVADQASGIAQDCRVYQDHVEVSRTQGSIDPAESSSPLQFTAAIPALAFFDNLKTQDFGSYASSDLPQAPDQSSRSYYVVGKWFGSGTLDQAVLLYLRNGAAVVENNAADLVAASREFLDRNCD